MGEEARVRRRGAQGAWTYVKTVKRALCGITREEIETEITREEYERRVKLLREAITAKAVTYNWHDCDTSFLEAVLARGDRKLVLTP